eukprot:Colp12_sorted_trinity150504_noHs@9746
MANSRFSRRLMKELGDLQKTPPVGFSLQPNPSLDCWLIDVEGAEGTLYEGEKFTLQFTFPANYPLDSPQVIFVGPNVPKHPHIYTNGHICLSILYDNWSPALSVQSVCLSILSMLSSSTEKTHPADNDVYIKRCSSDPKKTKWWFHDDKV